MDGGDSISDELLPGRRMSFDSGEADCRVGPQVDWYMFELEDIPNSSEQASQENSGRELQARYRLSFDWSDLAFCGEKYDVGICVVMEAPKIKNSSECILGSIGESMKFHA